MGSSAPTNLVLDASGKPTYETQTHVVQSSDIIDDIDLDGKIILDNGSQNIVFSGNALPKTDSVNEIISGAWTLLNLNIYKVGNDLVITRSGVSLSQIDGISNPSISRITVKNFPFTNEKGAFGITLGKKMDKTVGVETSTKSLSDSFLVNGGYALSSSTKKFFGAIRSTDSLGNVVDGVSDSIGFFDAEGTQLASRSLDGAFNSGAIDSSLITPDLSGGLRTSPAYPFQIGGKKYFAYPTSETGSVGDSSYSRAGAVLVDSSGNVVSSAVYANANSQTGAIRAVYSAGFATSKDNPDELYFIYVAASTNDNGRMVQKVDKTSLAAIGDPIGYSNHDWDSFGSAIYENAPALTLDPMQFALADETVISISDAGKTITSAIPKLRDLLPSEIIPNSDLAAGDQETDTALSRAILAFNDEGPDKKRREERLLKIMPRR